jgi:hypothetical protein
MYIEMMGKGTIMPTLVDELILLSIDEGNGRLVAPAKRRLPYVLAGATLEELALLGKVRVEENHRLVLVDPTASGDQILDEALDKIKSSEKPHKLPFWVEALVGKPKKMRQRMTQRLVDQGLVNEEDGHLSLVAPVADHPDYNASAKYWLKSRLREQVLACNTTELHDQALLGLLRAGGLLFLVFTRDELRSARRRIYESGVSMALQDPRAQVLEEVEAGIESFSG